MTSQFKEFFPDAMFTNNGAFQAGAEKALDVLRRLDLSLNHAGGTNNTHPLQGHQYIYQVVDGLAKIIGVQEQELKIGRGKWQEDYFLVEQGEGGVRMSVGVKVMTWEKQIDQLTGLVKAECRHDSDLGVLGYALVASILWDESSRETIVKRTDGSTRDMLTSQATPGNGHKLGAILTEGDAVGGDGRHGSFIPDDEI